MGARWSGQCYSTAEDAAAAMWSGVGPVVSAGSPPIVSTVEFSTVWQVVTRQNGVVLSVQDAPVPAFVACSEVDAVLDGMALAWLVVLVWAGAWAISILRRPLSWR